MRVFSRMFNKILNRLNTFRLSISVKSEANRIRKSLDFLKGTDVLILGSAPNPALPHDYKNRVLVCCNGSAANVKQLGLSDPVMTVVDFELIDANEALSKDVRSKIINGKLLSNLSLGYLVATQSNNAMGGKPELLNAEYCGYLPINRFTRRKIIDIITGTNMIERKISLSLCSTGGFAVALSLFLGARSVSIAGFTHLFTGEKHSQMHFYDRVFETSSNELNTRNHSLADSALISLSVINGYKINTCEPDILPLVQNWGNEGF